MKPLARCEFMLVTPELARTWLSSIDLVAEEFRSDAACHRYKKMMRRKEWMRNGSGPIIDWNGSLVDGRQRLAAVVLLGIPVPMDVVFDVSPEARMTMDYHRRRTQADHMFAAGVDDSTPVAAVCNAILCMAKRLPINHKENRQVLLQLATSHPDVEEALAAARQIRTVAGGYHAGPLAAAIFMTRRVDRERSDTFFAGMAAYEEGADETLPWNALVRHWRDMIEEGYAAVWRRTNAHVSIIRAWNAYVHGGALSFEYEKGDPIPDIVEFDAESVGLGEVDELVAGVPMPDYALAMHDRSVIARVVLMTPEWAEGIMKRNGPAGMGGSNQLRNRRMSKATLEQYVRDMRAGAWQCDGQAIKISILGYLLDGQHRLKACIESGMPFYTVIVEGLPENVFSTYDTHAKKNFGHYLASKGVPNAREASSALRILWRGMVHGFASKQIPSPVELAETEISHLTALGPSVEACSDAKSRRLMPTPIMATLHYVLSLEDREKADTFFGHLWKGGRLEPEDAILVLRDAILDTKTNGRAPLTEQDRLAWVLVAWTARKEEKPLVSSHLRRKSRFPAAYDGPLKLAKAPVPAPVRLSDAALRAA